MSGHTLATVIEDVPAAESLLTDAHDLVERLVREVAEAGDSGDSGQGMAVLPTRADVGELCLFAMNVRNRAEELADFAKTIEAWLPVLGEMEPNAALAASA